MWSGEAQVEDGKYTVTAHWVRCGGDLSVTVGGGERPHLGASALAIPRPSLSDPAKTSASVSVLCVTGHREDEFARRAAGLLAAEQGCVVHVCAGVHIEHAAPEELERLGRNLDALLDAVRARLNG
jgi:hypothetical protein